MGSFHSHDLAYLAADDRAIAALRRMWPSITHTIDMPSDIRCGDGRAVLCAVVGRLDKLPDALRAEIEGIDITPFEAYRRAKPIRTWGGEDDGSELASERALVRALTWMSAEAGGPVGHWHHEGDHGMIADVFIGVGPFAMWENDNESQGEEWDESRPRGAYTAALWHIGARVANLDEGGSLSRAFAFGRRRIPVAELSAESNSLAGRGQHGRDVSALTERLKRLFSAAPAEDHAGPSTVTAKWIARLKKLVSGD
jgi:hypothetical protein